MNLFNQVKKLVKEGYGRSVIQRELGLSARKARDMIDAVREKYPEFPKSKNGGKRELNKPYSTPGKNARTRKISKKEIEKALLKETDRDKIKYLKDRGHGSPNIARALNMTSKTVEDRMVEIDTKPKRITRAMILEEKMQSEDDLYELCKSMSSTPGGLKLMMERARGEYNPAGDAVKKMASKGAKFSELKKKFGNISLKRAKAIILENYPDHFIVETMLPGDDIRLTPVLDNSGKFEWMDYKGKDKEFKYFVNDMENYMSVKFDKGLLGNSINIFNITDIHIGAKAFRKEQLDVLIDHIATDPMAFFVIGGDLIEVVTKISVADPMEQSMSINEQVVEAVKTFMPIAHKCLAIEWGNHCGGRTEKAAQFDLARMIAQMLKVPYFRVRTIIDLEFRGMNKRISLCHKYGKALKTHQIMLEVKRAYSAFNFQVDCWFSGHNHDSFVLPIERTTLLPGEGFMQERGYVANGGSFIKYTGTYAEKEDYGHAPQDVVYFVFDDQGNHFADSIPMNSI